MSFENERKNIEEELLATWNSTNTPVKFSNVNGLVKGTSMVKESTGLSQWCRLQIVNADAENTVVGSGVIRNSGFIVASIFVKSGTGTDTARELCDDVVTIFQNKSFDGIRCQASTVTTEGDNEGFYQMLVSTAYFRDA